MRSNYRCESEERNIDEVEGDVWSAESMRRVG